MRVLLHIRAKTRCTTLQVHLPRQAGLHERIQTIVNGRVGNFRHRFFGAKENLIRRRMIALVGEHVIDTTSLRRETKTARAQLFSQVTFVLVCGCGRAQSTDKITFQRPPVKI